MNTRTLRSALTPQEVLAQWSTIAQTVKRQTAQPEREKSCPNFCTWDGWYVVNASDVMQMDAQTDEYTYAKPCPIHRKQGWTLPKGMEIGPRLHRPATSDQRNHPMRSAGSVEGWKSIGEITQVAIAFPEEPLAGVEKLEPLDDAEPEEPGDIPF